MAGFLAMVMLYLGRWTPIPAVILRILCLIPVTLFAYHYGMSAGLLLSTFYSAAFVPRLVVTLSTLGFGLPVIELVAFIAFINIFAYVVGDTFESLYSQEALESDLQDWALLLSKTSAMNEVLHFIVQEADALLNVERATLLFRNPLHERWEVLTPMARYTVPDDLLHSDATTLAQWLLQRREPLALNDLNHPPQFWVDDNSGVVLRSLLVAPLQMEGELLGVLALFNRQKEGFRLRDLDQLQDLLKKGTQALHQAALYARTDHALTRRVSELLTVQQTARALNATLEPKVILEQALACALEITGGDTGIASMARDMSPPLIVRRGLSTSLSGPALFEAAEELRDVTILSPAQFTGLSTNGECARLLAPIQRGQKLLGAILIASHARRLDEASLPACKSLMAHVAIALENAHLFEAMYREKQQVNLIIQSVADGLLTVDRSRRLLLFNPAAEQLTGWVAEDVLGRSCAEVLGCASGCINNCPLQRVMETGQVIQEEQRVIRRRLGTKQVIALSAAPLIQPNESPYGAVLLFRDITKQEELHRLQHEFVAAISHELRAPLTKISMVLDMLEQPEAPLETCLKILHNQNKQLTGFANKILQISHLEVGKAAVSIHPMPIARVVEEVVAAWQQTERSHLLALTLPLEQPWVWADERAVRVVLNELLDNAFKYTPAGTTITIDVQKGPTKTVQVTVQDQGPGIAAKHQVKVFEQFYRVDGSDAQAIYGHGLGLFIAKRFVEMMEGEIWLESDKGMGCRFAFTLPIMEESHERASTNY
jgi:PAS domain S-box-containing protein